MKTRILIITIFAMVAINIYAQGNRVKKKVKVETKVVDPQVARVNALFTEMLPNTQKLFIVDSLVVDVNDLALSIPLPKDCGSIVAYNDFFKTEKPKDSYVSVNGVGNKCFYSEMLEDSTYHVYYREKLGETWSKPQEVVGIGDDFDKIAYPIMMFDGTTMYFSATSKEGLGGYDLYVTSFDASEGTFMKAENAGLPFNSRNDDLLYLEDEVDGVAWLASTRHQPSGKVCIYTIALSATRQTYEGDDLDDSELRRKASIESISETWSSKEKRNQAIAKITSALQSHSNDRITEAQPFYVDDETIYYSVDDFTTAETKQLYKTLLRKQKQWNNLTETIGKLRKEYNSASVAQRKQMSTEILKVEKDINFANSDMIRTVKNLRQKERAALGK